MVDLFCGAGGFALGVDEACRALNLGTKHVLAADIEPDMLATFVRNFQPHEVISDPIERVVDGDLGSRLTASERQLRRRIGEITLATGGPPCQGHSDLNNHTRRSDPKNALYARMARFAEIAEPESLIIENVPGVRRDRGGVFELTALHLERLGYAVEHRVVDAEAFGVPQRRRRVIVLATRRPCGAKAVWDSIDQNCKTAPRTVGWAIGDLLGSAGIGAFDAITQLSAESKRRVDWMYDNDQHDLPDRLRPDCHRLKVHSYKAVYGRLYWDRPSWTITTGFQVMGQGRFLHPKERRVLTSHEAARLQFLPDFLAFSTSSRKGYAKMIGNAIPPKIAYLIALELLR